MDLFLICNGFPYSAGDSFLRNELDYLSARFNTVTIFNLVKNKADASVKLPANITVVNQAAIALPASRLIIFTGSFWFIVKTLFKEWKDCKDKRFFAGKARHFISELINSIILAKKIATLGWQKEQTVFYSFWMNSGALALSYLKYQRKIKTFVFRVHGFDLYKERHPNNYLPFRKTNYDYADKIFAISDLGKKYIRDNYDNYSKVQTSHLGTGFYGSGPFDPDAYTIVSCSNIIALKRLGLICKALQGINDMQVNWLHFGDGNLKEELVAEAKKLPANINFKLMGFVTPDALFNFYKTNPVSVFINVSETEGLPVSIMEAISFGIPVMATDVGGTSEIVTAETGILLNKDITEADLGAAIRDFFTGKLNTIEFRKHVSGFWKAHFSSEANYMAFCDELHRLTKQ